MFVDLRKCLILSGNIFLIVLPLTKAVYSKYKWSEPVQLSGEGIYPDTWHFAPAIAVGRNGVLHAFWVKNIEFMDMKWYYKTEYMNLAENTCCILKKILR